MVHLIDILAAKARISQLVHKTPIWRSTQLNHELGCDIYFKCEPLQKTGSFRLRGVFNFLKSQTAAVTCVCTYSTGNQGQALAFAASTQHLRAVIFAPEQTPIDSLDAIRGYGGEVVLVGKSTEQQKEACLQFAEREKALFVPPFDEVTVICGQGTVMLEVLEDVPLMDDVVVPTGGGSLVAGIATVVKTLRPYTRVFTAEPEKSNVAQLSLVQGKRKRLEQKDNNEDSVQHRQLGEITWPVIHDRVDEGLTCTEDELARAMSLIHRYLKLVVEPRGALAFGCLLANRKKFEGRRVVIILTGGNISPADYATVFVNK